METEWDAAVKASCDGRPRELAEGTGAKIPGA
jgi:hypothetical protein